MWMHLFIWLEALLVCVFLGLLMWKLNGAPRLPWWAVWLPLGLAAFNVVMVIAFIFVVLKCLQLGVGL